MDLFLFGGGGASERFVASECFVASETLGGVVRFNCFGLNQYRGVAALEVRGAGGDSSGDIAAHKSRKDYN